MTALEKSNVVSKFGGSIPSLRALPATLERPAAGGAASNDATFSLLTGAQPRLDISSPQGSPWSCGALLNFVRQNQLVSVGTAFLIEPDVLLTAKHCISDSEPYDAVGVWIAYDARYNNAVPPIGISAFALHATLDIAVFILQSSFGCSIAMGDAPTQQGAQLNLSGYAMPYDDGSVRYSSGSGSLVSSTGISLAYYINTRPGDSGAPVFYASAGTTTAVAVHTESTNGLELGNSGVALSSAVRGDIATLIDFARSQVR